VVLVIDEAQNLEPGVLEQIRLISNLETERDKLIQIILSGQPELEELLARPDLRQIAQRITVRYHLYPMDREDMAAYIRHRLEVAGGVAAALFSPKALELVHAYSGGYPRLVNIACDRILLAAYGDETREITPRLAQQAIAELKRRGTTSRPLRPWLLAAAILLLALAATLAWRTGLVTPPLRPDTSRLQAFNAVAAAQGRTPYRPAQGTAVPPLPRLARSRQMGVETVSGTAADLLARPLPLLLQLTLPNGQERWLALLPGQGSGIRIAPRLGKRDTVTREELAALQPDRAHILRPLGGTKPGGTP
jgi:general secretion pathway protein A